MRKHSVLSSSLEESTLFYARADGLTASEIDVNNSSQPGARSQKCQNLATVRPMTPRFSAQTEHADTAPSAAPPLTSSDAAPRSTIAAWALWDAGGAAFNAVMTTFVFGVYLTSKNFGNPEHASSVMSMGLTLAGLLIALTAPITGQRSDTSGKRTFWLGFNMCAVSILMALCFFVAPSESYLYLGVALIALGNIMNEFATVNYNAILPQISTPHTVGRISGIGWASGYFGGIVALAIVLVFFIGLGSNTGLLGIPSNDALNIRAVAVFCAVWATALSIPLLVSMRRRDRLNPPLAQASTERMSFKDSYKELFSTIRRLFKQAPQTLYFLFASAIFRDGLTGVFTYGGIFAAGTFGFTTTQVVIFAIAGNVVAGIGALIGGKLDDVIGPKMVIIISLAGVLCAATPLLFSQEQIMFWICGLLLCSFVGPAQSASRTYLSRLTPRGQEGEIFGLYSTTGRAASFLAPALFALFMNLLGAQIWGIVGIMVVIALGLGMVLPLTAAPQRTVLKNSEATS